MRTTTRMQLLTRTFLIIIIAARLTAPAHGLSGKISEVACPVCSKQFISTIVDAPGQAYYNAGRSETCPYCLYTAVCRDFRTPTPEEVERLRSMLVELRATLQRTAPEVLGVELDEVIDHERPLIALIGMACYERRAFDVQPPARFARWAHEETRRHGPAHFAPTLRGLAITQVEEGLKLGVFTPEQAARFAHLLGGLHLRADDRDTASTWLDRAQELAAQAPEPDRNVIRRIDRDRARLAVKSMTTPELGEALIHFGDRVRGTYDSYLAGAAANELYRRNDAEAWVAIEQGVKASPDHLVSFLRTARPTVAELKQSPEMWRYMEDVHAAGATYPGLVERIEYAELLGDLPPDDPRAKWIQAWAALLDGLLDPLITEYELPSRATVERIASRVYTTPERLRELNESLANAPMAPSGFRVRYVTMPPEWPEEWRDEERLLGRMCELLSAGEPEALDYFMRWLETAGPAAIALLDANKWIAAFREAPELWPAMRSASPTFSREIQEIVWACMLLNCDPLDETETLYTLMKPRLMALLREDGEWSELHTMALSVFHRRGDTCVKSWAIGQCSDTSMISAVTPYLRDVCVGSDIPALEQAIVPLYKLRLRGGGYRAAVERVIRSVNLRKL